MIHRAVGHSSLNVGRYSGRYQGAPNYRVRYLMRPFLPVDVEGPILRWNHDSPRLLYHSGLDDVIYYPQIPTETHGFGFDLLTKRDLAQAKTLTSNATQQWAAIDEDTVVKEIYTGQISQRRAFFEALYRFYRADLGIDGYMMWRPLDLTDKMYRVKMIELMVGGETMDLKYVGTLIPDKWLQSPIEVHLKLIPTPAPTITTFASGLLLANANCV